MSSVWMPYCQMATAPEPLEVARTDGVHLLLADGRRLIDGCASWWTACHGYNHPHIRQAVEAQLETLPHVMLGGLIHEPVQKLARRLAAVLPGDLEHAFFSESGSVAVEVALKMALQYWLNRGERRRRRFACFRHAYHGDTFAAMSICDPEEGMHALFKGVLAEQLLLDVPSTASERARFDAALGEHAPKLAGLIIEPLVQAAGGMKFHTAETLAHIVASARRHGLLVIFDEIATGFGRTGTMFACEQAQVVPDIITLGKALTGGTLPLAVTVARKHVYEAFLSTDSHKALMHGPTFSGNALACAAANASLDLFESEPRLAQVTAIETQLRAGLERCRKSPAVADVRVKGAIGVVELKRSPDLDALRARFVAAGVWVRPFGNIVYLMPPLTISASDLQTLIDAVVSFVAEGLE
jgi:adenosylmethionine-8-amino-7-oxononanoate aminotransferase